MCTAAIAMIFGHIVTDAPSSTVGNGDCPAPKRNSPCEFSPFPGFFNQPRN